MFARVAATIAAVLVLATLGAFTTSERATVTEMRQRIRALEVAAAENIVARDATTARLTALEARTTGLESDATLTLVVLAVDALTARLTALEAVPTPGPSVAPTPEPTPDPTPSPTPSPEPTAAPFVFTDIRAIPGPLCQPGTCYVDIVWHVSPCATGQVEWGRSVPEYGNLTRLEPRLLCFHRQRIRSLDPATEYHFRVIATDGSTIVARAVVG